MCRMDCEPSLARKNVIGLLSVSMGRAGMCAKGTNTVNDGNEPR